MSSTLDLWDPRFLRTIEAWINRTTEPCIPEPTSDFTKNFELTLPRPGGADRVRTDDLRLARAALSQLSYSPFSGGTADQSARQDP